MAFSKKAVMNVNEGEEIVGGWATAPIPGTGAYKLLAKKRKDGVIEWAHFIQRASGVKKVIFRGEAVSRQQLDVVIEIANENLKRLFGVSLQAVEYDMYTLDGKKISGAKH
ncbi:MAG: hypothetical protein DYG87_02105 [Anaerolineae bacterium CFX3]|jgi:hypothetical protein|nr:hypothetical protein [Anaerolineae bacterium CFX3]MCQ3945604.1 hypothetical protein [Anaerolineae bacterium]OQY82653.1 MAG: hypothetical protein B6D40_08680 [Anaerolineae bacterium UTCFX3]RIK28084.1 MAG: hypothetical protein DCC54_00890 [Anaerolineae bacterium]